MFNSKAQFLEFTKVSYKATPSIKESGKTLSQYRDDFIKQLFGERADTNNAESLFSESVDFSSYVKFSTVGNIVYCDITINNNQVRIATGDANTGSIIKDELDKLCLKSSNNVTKAFSDRLFDYVYDVVNSYKFKEIINKLKEEAKSENIDFFGYVDSDMFYEIYKDNFAKNVFNKNAKLSIDIEGLGSDVVKMTANHKSHLIHGERMFDSIKIEDEELVANDDNDDYVLVDSDYVVKLALKGVISDQIGVHLRNIYLNKDSLKKDDRKTYQKFFINEFLKFSYLSVKYYSQISHL